MEEEVKEEEKKIQWYFSLFSGLIYHADADEILDVFQIPLKEEPSKIKNCSTCYGRFYISYDLTNRHYTPCPRCLKKYADLDKMHIVKTDGKN